MATDLKRAAHLGKPRAPTESMEQRALAQYLDMLRLTWCHVPNGAQLAGRAGPRVAGGILVGHGMKAGVPDVLIFQRPPIWKLGDCACGEQPKDRCRFHGRTAPKLLLSSHNGVHAVPHGIAIELKRVGATMTAVSVEQQEWIRKLGCRGWYAFVARGAGEAIDELRLLGFG